MPVPHAELPRPNSLLCSLAALWGQLRRKTSRTDSRIDPVERRSREMEHVMNQGFLYFDVTALEVEVQETVKLKWQGREIDSGRLSIKLGAPGSHGVINYETGKVNVEFRVRIMFDELSEILDDMGEESGVGSPVDAVIRSLGSVFEDHSLRLAGRAEISEHPLFDPHETRIEIRAPTH